MLLEFPPRSHSLNDLPKACPRTEEWKEWKVQFRFPKRRIRFRFLDTDWESDFLITEDKYESNYDFPTRKIKKVQWPFKAAPVLKTRKKCSFDLQFRKIIESNVDLHICVSILCTNTNYTYMNLNCVLDTIQGICLYRKYPKKFQQNRLCEA